MAIVAAGAISALGTGEDAVSVGVAGAVPETAIRRDDELVRAGLARPFAARVRSLDGPGDRAARLLERAGRELVDELDRVLPEWRSRRVALLVGTSGGGMPSLERALAERAAGGELERGLAEAAFYAAPLRVLSELFGRERLGVQVLSACASSTLAIGLGCRWLEAGHADLVIAGGYDALSLFIASGFEALGATSAGAVQPFRRERDGMALGEGAALVALSRTGEAPARLGVLLGFGASSDAWHVTAPDPSGDGLARAARAALADAELEPAAVELVSAHATATPHNDAAEAGALASVLGPAGASVLHPYKAVIGHALGAAGVLELLAALRALREGVLPAALGAGSIDPPVPARLLERNASGQATSGLKLSSAFGGANAALVFAARTPAKWAAARLLRPVRLLARGRPVLEPSPEQIARSSLGELARTRLDRASALAVSAAAEVVAEDRPARERIAVIVGTFAASLEANEVFDERRRSGGVAAAPPRRFPATSPNLPAGQCSIGFGLRGPSLAIGGGPNAAIEALLVAHDLVAAGDADAAVVIACDDVGPTTLALCRAAGIPAPSDGALALFIGVGDERAGPVLERAELARAVDPGASAAERVPAMRSGWPVLLAAARSADQRNH